MCRPSGHASEVPTKIMELEEVSNFELQELSRTGVFGVIKVNTQIMSPEFVVINAERVIICS